MQRLLELFRTTGDAATLAELARGLEIGDRAGEARDDAREARDDAAEGSWLSRDGYAVLGDAILPDACDRMVRGVEGLVEGGLPPIFLYAFDAPWTAGERLRARVSAMLDRRYALVEDLWAWHVRPGTGRGWRPHRGVPEPLLEREAPELLNVWLALSDVTAERACMHVVPLDEDPAYPTALDRVDAALESVRALPVPAGTALAWNANLLHWGGACAARAPGPRVSCSFTLVREDAIERLGGRVIPAAGLAFQARIDAIARQIVIYGETHGEIEPDVLGWARAVCNLPATLEVRT
jgi:hypothetical protein